MMKTLKLTSLFAAMTMVTGIAMAQPQDTNAPPPPPMGQGTPGQPGEHRGGMAGRQGDGGPAMKLMAASKLQSLTPEQKTQIDALLEAKKAEMQGSREEMKAAMEKAKAATDPEERRKAMEPLRQKMQEEQKDIDAKLKGILTPEQEAELGKQAQEMRGNWADRMKAGKGDNDKMTSGAAQADRAGKPGKEGRPGKDGKKGKKGKKGNKGDRAGKPGNKAAAADDSATSSTAANPFADQ